ncbi:type II secretion system minor pseudopilin GspJ [Sphingomonas sp. C3-2]|uniref:type II secretion system minor pseudopilin GspJ n=1 Tax=Sphingomonas sp. C3-2 TaxID=3062169 RepID=UPI00294B5756|nr:type II secretion system minor pseudopilin GspJ [Sphingomonas sp. C3-2]WOK36827.1 type II secretion system minor pseudopilin GspJ [Sphingomonas sp. C3-2]
MTARGAERGFTLVELMVALLIFSMLAAAGVALLGASVRGQEAAGKRLDEMAELRRMDTALSVDLGQALPRTSRNEAGDRVPAFEASADDFRIALVRGGWSNPSGSNRSALQKVEYRLVDGRIERTAYAMADGAAALEPAVLMENVTAARLRFRVKGEWFDRWESARADALPQALELVVARTDGAEIRQLFLVGSGN